MKEGKISNVKKTKEERIYIRVTPNEKDQIEDIARSHKISVSKLVVDTVINQRKLHYEKATEIGEMLCDLAYEVGYIKSFYSDCIEDLAKIERRSLELWRSLKL